jgi:hypothetical protein
MRLLEPALILRPAGENILGGASRQKEATVSITDELLENDARHAEEFSGPLPLPPSQHIAIVACRMRGSTSTPRSA